MLLQIELFVLAAMLVVMVAAWAYGLAVKNGGWTDVFWTWGTGVVLAAAAVVASPDTGSWMRWIVPGMIFLWALRLGAYLTPRVAKHPEDTRYAAFREGDPKAYPLKMLFVTLPQAPATALLGLSVVVAAMHPPALEVRYDLGLAVFVAAVGLEGISDSQMKAFRANPANKGKVMETGLWAWSRHPNYFFQWLGWLAYPVIALDPSLPVTWLTLVGPAVMFGLLRYVSGVPPLEEAMLKSRGDKFRDYQKRVSVFFPLPPKQQS
ncbi:MAG: DUF1295 domain-containing protein [Caulobacteraceae bacterium]|uniref:DUF1295 domain-containing protein n=1 Tax=Phenylobacterium sp. TaxID=1871053 RepID=UPI0011F4D2E9|nr:DUF1295 domain-containing protein [Phenylobacterium sp.]MBX9708526.1 DUF1295 domain-containing protein [Caulobacteraceae bacterium]TAL34664.1 MAG: DUF1295 domain-containing protein [Phenylobacterium sp.]